MNTFSIAVVDDDADFLQGIIRHLKKQFHTVNILGFTSGEDALDVFKNREIGVLLSDLRMPGMSGHDLLTKALDLNPYVCVIMITGFATVENAVQSLKTGAWDFITKPVERQALFHTVERAIQHYALARENQRLKFLVSGLTPEKRQWESRTMNQIQEKSRPWRSQIIPFSSRGNPAAARSLWPEKSTACLSAARFPAMPSTARPFRSLCWKVNCSAMSGVRSPGRNGTGTDFLWRQTKEL